MRVSVLIVDDHALLRQGLRQVLADENPEFECAEASGFDAAIDVLAAGDVDLLLIDLGMPGMAGADSLRALREAYPSTKIAVITGQGDRDTILACLGAGVHGYILKTSAVDEIHRAVTIILGGGVYVAPELTRIGAAGAVKEHTPSPEPPTMPAPEIAGNNPRFTSRQRDVLRLLAEGRSTKEIARMLGLGPGTVKIHLAAIFRALNAQNRTEAVVLAAKLRL